MKTGTALACPPSVHVAHPPAPPPAPAAPRFGRVDLFEKLPWLERIVKARSFRFWAVLPNLALFHLLILAGLFGTPIGSHNLIIVFVWILWWFALIAVVVPLAGRAWCTMCPLPFFGDWLQRRRLVQVRQGYTAGFRNAFSGLNRRWPRRLSNTWLQNAGFLTLALFGAMLVTRPIASVLVFAGLFGLTVALAYVYRLRAFCRYVCPIGGCLSLYSMTSTLELRPVDASLCRRCMAKSCLQGSDNGWACPWGVYMGGLDRNNDCGLCMECVKSCPHDNVSLFARPFASDRLLKGYDEVWKASIVLTVALSYSVVLLGPWGTLKNWANVSESRDWLGFGLYAGITILVALVVLPGLFYLAVRAGRWLASDGHSMRDLFIRFAYTLVPLGLLAWIACSVPLVMINGAYIVSVVSDPLGWGMDLFGTAAFHWQPLLPAWVPYVQVPLLLAGLWLSLRSGVRVARDVIGHSRRAVVALAPVAGLLTVVTVAFLVLFVG